MVPLDFGRVSEAVAAQGVDVWFMLGAREDGAFVAIDGAEVRDGGGWGDGAGGGGGAGFGRFGDGEGWVAVERGAGVGFGGG